MKHYTGAEWMDYVNDQLSVEAQKEYELHLYSCEPCLLLYMDCFAAVPDSESAERADKLIYSDEKWIEQIMERIEVQKQPIQPLVTLSRKVALYRKPVFQYALAAVITVLLMATGVFHGITGGTGQSSSAAKQTLKTSYTDQLMDRTVAMLDAMQLKANLIEEGGEHPE